MIYKRATRTRREEVLKFALSLLFSVVKVVWLLLSSSLSRVFIIIIIIIIIPACLGKRSIGKPSSVSLLFRVLFVT